MPNKKKTEQTQSTTESQQLQIARKYVETLDKTVSTLEELATIGLTVDEAKHIARLLIVQRIALRNRIRNFKKEFCNENKPNTN